MPAQYIVLRSLPGNSGPPLTPRLVDVDNRNIQIFPELPTTNYLKSETVIDH